MAHSLFTTQISTITTCSLMMNIISRASWIGVTPNLSQWSCLLPRSNSIRVPACQKRINSRLRSSSKCSSMHWRHSRLNGGILYLEYVFRCLCILLPREVRSSDMSCACGLNGPSSMLGLFCLWCMEMMLNGRISTATTKGKAFDTSHRCLYDYLPKAIEYRWYISLSTAHNNLFYVSPMCQS